MVLLAFIASLIIFITAQKNTISPAFSVLEEPTILTKGQNGATLIVEISFLHDEFELLLPLLKDKQAVLLIEPELAARFPSFVEQLKEQQLTVGLYNAQQPETIAELTSKLEQFEALFQTKPLFYTQQGYMIKDELLQYLHAQQINTLAPSIIYDLQQTKLPNGAFLFVPLHADSQISFTDLRSFLNEQNFLSIEENLFQYTIKTKRSP